MRFRKGSCRRVSEYEWWNYHLPRYDNNNDVWIQCYNESYRRRIQGSNLCWTNARQYPQVGSDDSHIPVGPVCIELMLLWLWVTDIDWEQPCNSHTSVARLWLAPLLSRNLTTLSWFSWAAMYRGVKPFCDCMLTEAPCLTSSFTTSSCPAKQNKPRSQFSQWCCCCRSEIFWNVTCHLYTVTDIPNAQQSFVIMLTISQHCVTSQKT